VGLLAPATSGVVHQDIEAAEARRRGVDDASHIGLAADVQPPEAGGEAPVGQLVGEGRAFALKDIGDRHRRAFLRHAKAVARPRPSAAPVMRTVFP
jgi:hypothetical protein